MAKVGDFASEQFGVEIFVPSGAGYHERLGKVQEFLGGVGWAWFSKCPTEYANPCQAGKILEVCGVPSADEATGMANAITAQCAVRADAYHVREVVSLVTTRIACVSGLPYEFVDYESTWCRLADASDVNWFPMDICVIAACGPVHGTAGG